MWFCIKKNSESDIFTIWYKWLYSCKKKLKLQIFVKNFLHLNICEKLQKYYNRSPILVQPNILEISNKKVENSDCLFDSEK